MLEYFFPDNYVDSAYTIDYKALYEEGIRGLIYDIDNTLVEHGADASKEAIALMEQLRKMGFAICFLSNNKEPRVKRFNEKIHAPYLYKGGKPKRGGYEKAMALMGTNMENTVFVGDQLFTDIYGAKRTGIRNILVKPIGEKEEIQIVLKRYLERIVLSQYKKKEQKSYVRIK